MTNREKLAQMTNEELAELTNISTMCDFCIFNNDDYACIKQIDCVLGHLLWLESEVEE